MAEWPVFTYLSQQKVTLELLDDWTGSGEYMWYSPFIQTEEAGFIFESSMKRRFAKMLMMCVRDISSLCEHVGGVVFTSTPRGKLGRGRAISPAPLPS